MRRIIAETPRRLVIRLAESGDAAFICTLWNDPRVDEKVYEFPESMRNMTSSVHALVYHVSRSVWLKKNKFSSHRTVCTRWSSWQVDWQSRIETRRRFSAVSR